MDISKSIATKQPHHSNPTSQQRKARAPYNFVPLPDKLVTVDPPPPLHSYTPEIGRKHYTGWFECDIETCSPIYVRGPLTLDEFEHTDRDKELSVEQKLARAAFYSHDFDPSIFIEGRSAPVIPASTLRGMLRGLVEIISYGKMIWVNRTPRVTFRAVASSREDPLTAPYREMVGSFARNIKAGFLKKLRNDDWAISPAPRPRTKGWPDDGAFLKVREADIPSGAITDFKRFDDPDYWPEYYEVSYNVSIKRGRRGQYAKVVQIGDADAGYNFRGTLVCTGNMLETAKPDKESPRRNHALILRPDGEEKPTQFLRISSEILQDYRESLTFFQRDEIWPDSGLEDDGPVFYIADNDRVIWFGHTPNFRIPARVQSNDSNCLRAARPTDFIPKALRGGKKPDLAEAIFGWVADPSNLDDQWMGRVSFTDATYIDNKDGVWFQSEPITPAVLAGPKVTTFQHYLVQDRSRGHDPDNRQTLAHFTHAGETTIRGYKRYWHKGTNPQIQSDPTGKANPKESQLTRFLPVKPGVHFRCRIHFESLRDYELGALAWALELPGEAGCTYRQKIGMGKPLGMGAVAIHTTLHLTDRLDRYSHLFSGGRLATGEHIVESHLFIKAFEEFILRGEPHRIAPDKARLAEVERIRMLLALLQWHNGTKDWLDWTRYQLIEHKINNNEYKERPVLEDPLAFSAAHRTATVTRSSPSAVGDFRFGAVREWRSERAFGFIAADGMNEKVFVHSSQLCGLASLRPGQRVKFKLQRSQRGWEATDVSPAE
jgi:CRISPR-associated protein (TIGR03986 family)